MVDGAKPAEVIARLVAARKKRPDRAILDELGALEALPDERDPAWQRDETWQRAYLLIALSDHVALRRLAAGIGLVLDRMCLGDPGEMMRGMRHAMEGAVEPDWSRLTEICVSRCSSERAGTRYWAVDELAILRDPTALPVILRLFDDPEREVATTAFRAATMLLQEVPGLRPRVIKALREIGERRAELREEADREIRDLESSA